MSGDRIHGGVLPVNKPEGMTSFDVVARIRRLYGTKQVGHTGTLDPMATGVLVLLVGRAVKASELITADSKSYTARLKLGITSDTLDITGKIKNGDKDRIPSEEEFVSSLEKFRGRILQMPPMYSALKVGGVKLCDAARRGLELERQEREVEISSLRCRRISEDEYELSVVCSKGTYIRTLCDDIGKELGCGGVMSYLERTASGAFSLSGCRSLEELEKMSEDERYLLLMPVEKVFESSERVDLPDFFERLARQGNEIYQRKINTSFDEGETIRLYGRGRFFALGRVTAFPGGSAIKPIKQFDI